MMRRVDTLAIQSTTKLGKARIFLSVSCHWLASMDDYWDSYDKAYEDWLESDDRDEDWEEDWLATWEEENVLLAGESLCDPAEGPYMQPAWKVTV